MRIIVDTMKIAEIETLIEEYNERERIERNQKLRARLARPCSREELFMRLSGLASTRTNEGTGQILLTKFSSPYIMEATR